MACAMVGLSGDIGPADPGAEPSSAERIGSAFALFDGADATWYLLDGGPASTRRSSALIVPSERRSGEYVAVLTGFDWPDVDLGSFEMSEAGFTSYGTYQGSVLTISFPFGARDHTRRFSLTGASPAAVLYARSVAAAREPASTFFSLETGTLSIETLEVVPGAGCRIAGVFSGAFVRMDQEEQIMVTDGTFDVSECLLLEHADGSL